MLKKRGFSKGSTPHAILFTDSKFSFVQKRFFSILKPFLTDRFPKMRNSKIFSVGFFFGVEPCRPEIEKRTFLVWLQEKVLKNHDCRPETENRTFLLWIKEKVLKNYDWTKIGRDDRLLFSNSKQALMSQYQHNTTMLTPTQKLKIVQNFIYLVAVNAVYSSGVQTNKEGKEKLVFKHFEAELA